MTQVKSAQRAGKKLALHRLEDARSLAQRRADFAAQMRAMALTDLEQVSKRLKGLRKELERKEGHRIPQHELATRVKIPPRTFQSWENGEVENSDGEGYQKLARYYSRRLGRRITKNWILFEQDEAPPMPSESPREQDQLDRIEESLSELDAKLDSRWTQLLAELSALRSAQEAALSPQARAARDRATKRS